MKNKITGRSAFLALLKDEGVTHLFGNPGTTELPIMHALKDHPDLTYVMAMQESAEVEGGFLRDAIEQTVRPSVSTHANRQAIGEGAHDG